MAVILVILTNRGYAQNKVEQNKTISTLNTPPDSITNIPGTIDTNKIKKTDSVSLKRDSLRKNAIADTSRKKRLEDSLGIRISKDELPSPVTATAVDSAVIDLKHNHFYLYGNAKVNYEDLELDAGEVVFDQAINVVTAQPSFDTAGKSGERPSFTQGKDKFTYDSLQYNFKSKRAIVRNAHSQYGEGFVQSEQVKRNPDQSIFGYHSIYTTCALDTPHFGIVAKKIKVIPGHIIASGPANIVIEGVPTPIFLPFGLFPITQGQKSGFILPAYTVEQARGLGITNGGYYFSLSDYTDLLTEANIYTKGSYSVSGVSTYADRYHYSGGVSLSYAYNKTGEDYEPGSTISKDFMFLWQHQTDAKSIPGQSFNANVTVGTSTYFSNNSYKYNQILQNQYSSNISFSKSWAGTPFSLVVSARHSQNTGTRQVQVTLPDVNFHITQLNPFQSKKSVGIHWWDKITISYSFDMLNETNFIDTTFSFNTLSFKSFQIGAHHTIPISASYTIFRFINMSFSINYNEYWLTDKLYEQFDPASDRIDSNDSRGFFTARDFNAGVNFSTRIYGMKLFKSGKLRGIRHVLTPSVGFTYHPDFGAEPFNYYYRSRIDSFNYQYLSPYMTSIVGVPPGPGKQGNVNFGLNNNVQIKVKSDKDTATGYKNVTLIDGLSITSAYNIAADSFQWSPIAMSFRTNVLDKINISGSATFDPYALDYQTGQRLPETMLQEGTGIARFTNAVFAVGTNFHSKPLNSNNKPTNSEEYGRLMRNGGINDYADFNIPWSFNLSYALNVTNNWSPFSGKDTLATTQNLMFQGNFNLTERWKISLSSGYDFTLHQLTLTSIDVFRDLHCWEIHFQTIPFGPRKSFMFQLNVKAAVLQDLKLVRRRDYRDAVD